MRSNRLLPAAACLFALIIVHDTSAANAGENSTALMQALRDDIIESISTADEDTQFIPVRDATRAVDTGARSGYAAWCGVEWEESSYFALMRFERQKGSWTGKQLTYIGMMHGVTKRLIEETLRDNGSCSPEEAETIKNAIDAVRQEMQQPDRQRV